jgi:hypothetical protein
VKAVAALASLIVVLTAFAGCGRTPKLVAVTGKVSHQGKAVTGGSVWFHPEEGSASGGERMSGQLQIDGSFTVRTFPHGDGILPGRYRVTLSPDLAGRAGAPRYGRVLETPWTVEVPDNGLADLVLEIK